MTTQLIFFLLVCGTGAIPPNCTACADGYYFNTTLGGCWECGPNSVSTSPATECTECDPGYFRLNASTCDSCPPGSAYYST